MDITIYGNIRTRGVSIGGKFISRDQKPFKGGGGRAKNLRKGTFVFGEITGPSPPPPPTPDWNPKYTPDPD